MSAQSGHSPQETSSSAQATPTADARHAQPAGAAELGTELRRLDEQLASEAEVAIQTSVMDVPFELEGEFLSQEEIARLITEDETSEETAEGVPRPDESPAAAQVAESHVATSAEAEQKQPTQPSAADLVHPVEAPAVAESAAEQPAAPTPGSPASTPLVEQIVESPGADEVAPAGISLPEAEIEHALDQPAVEPSEAAAEPSGPARPPGYRRLLLRLVNLLDMPFRRIPGNVKDIVGLVGGVTCLVALAVWIVAMVRRLTA